MNAMEMTSKNEIYLDAAGAALPDEVMMRNICAEMMSTTFGNPHSAGSKLGDGMLTRSEEARQEVLKHFNVYSDEYDVVFTSGTTSAMNLVGHNFPWTHMNHLCYPMNSHTSLLGLRGYAQNSHTIPSKHLQHYNTIKQVWFKDVCNSECIDPSRDSGSYNLLLVPGECNFSGVKADLEKVGKLSLLHGNKLLEYLEATSVTSVGNSIPQNDYPWLWLLDAAKLAATSPVDLSVLPKQQRPHFVVMSFYKVFGYPTGLGALLIRRDIAPILQKRYHGGGTLLAAAANSSFMRPKRTHPHEYLEDGTPHFYGIAALRHCFASLRARGGMQALQDRCFELTAYLVRGMRALCHSTEPSLPLCVLYGANYESDQQAELVPSRQGPIVTFNVRWRTGAFVGFSEVGRRAAEAGIQLRTGCFCNVGGCQEALGLSAVDVEHNYSLGRVCSDSGHDLVNGRPTGAVRVSLGQTSSYSDCDTFLRFLREAFLDAAPAMLLSAPEGASAEQVPQSFDSLFRTAVTSTQPSDDFDKPCESVEEGAGTRLTQPILLTAIFVYPIKSCAGVRVDAWPLCPTGLLYDRAWALVDAAGRAITQKAHPRLALVQPSISLSEGVMLVHAPGMSEVLVIPLEGEGAEGVQPCADTSSAEADASTVSVCGQVRRGRKISFNADQWFALFLAGGNQGASNSSAPKPLTSCTLLRSVEAPPKRGEYSAAENGSAGSAEISFANTAQFLLLSLESVRTLTQLILSSHDAATKGNLNIKVENFRPNLVVSGGAGLPHQEDTWQQLQLPVVLRGGESTECNPTDSIGDASRLSLQTQQQVLRLVVTGPCARCSMVNVDGSSGSMDCRAFQALATYRREGAGVYFGQFCSLQSHPSLQEQDRTVWLSTGTELVAALKNTATLV